MLATVLTVLAIVGGANAHIWWDTPLQGAYPSQMQPDKTLCPTRNDTAAATTLMFNGGSAYAYGVRVNAHGGGQFKVMWYPATTTDNVTYTFGAGVSIMVNPAFQNFTNSTTSATVTGMYPGAAMGYGVLQVAAETKDVGNKYYACRWAHATAMAATTGTPPAATTGAATTGVAGSTTGAAGGSTTGVATTTGTTTGVASTGVASTGIASTGMVVATTGKKSSAGALAASLASVVAAATMAALA
jgi:hypothetical protein